MNRTLLLLVAVVALGVLAWFALAGSGAQSSSRAVSNDREFAYPEFSEVDRIFIADRRNHQVTLTRGGVTGWLSDGKPANENIMKNLVPVLRDLEIRTLPTSKAVPNMIKTLATEGIRVQLYDKEGNELRDYYLGGATHDELGTFAIMDGSENPYVVHLPNFTGNVKARLNHWGDEWRDRVYFRVVPEQLEELRIDYPKQQNKSFRLVRDGEGFRVSPLYDTGQPTATVPRGVAERVLSKYEKYYVNRFENGDREAIAEARQLLPFAIISVKQEGEEEKVMTVYPKYDEQQFTTDPKTGATNLAGGLAAFRAFINEGEDWVLLNVETTQPLLVGYDNFR